LVFLPDVFDNREYIGMSWHELAYEFGFFHGYSVTNSPCSIWWNVC